MSEESDVTATVGRTSSARRRWLVLLFWILVIPIVAFGVAQGVHAKYQGDLVAAVEQSLGRPLTPEERATVGVDAYCVDPQSAGDPACADLAIATIMEVVAVVAVIVGGLLLAFIAFAGRAARADRAALLRLFRPGLIVTLLGLVVLVVADGLLAVGTLYLGLGVFAGRIAPILLLAIAAGALIAAFGIVKAVVRISRRTTTSVLGRRLDAATQPRIHGFVQDLATQLGAEAPEHIVVGLDPEFFVTEVDVRTLEGMFTGRTLYLSLPLSRILTTSELRSVIGHELGHFRGSDTKFSKDFYPVYRGAGESVAALASGARTSGATAITLIPALLLVGRFIDAFAVPERTLSRQREFAADQAGAEATTPADLGTALVKVSAFAPLWPRTTARLIAASQGAATLDNAGRDFVDNVRAGANPTALEGLDASPIVHPTDSHPPLSERLSALGVRLEDVATTALVVAPEQAGSDLLVDPDQLEVEMTALARARIAAMMQMQAGRKRP